MNLFLYMLKIAYYFIFGLVMYCIAQNHEILLARRNNGESIRVSSRRIGVIAIVILALLWAHHTVFCSSVPPRSDRLRYAVTFESGMLARVRKSSFGLYVIEFLLHKITNNSLWLFISIAVLCVSVTLIAYNTYPQATSESLLFLGLSTYLLFACYALKQAPANALVGLSVAGFMKKNRAICIGSLTLAILFHEAAWIMVPIYIVLLGSKRRSVRFLQYALLLVCLFDFVHISTSFLNLLSNLIPGFSAQISSYIDESGELSVGYYGLTVIKGLPIYIISIVGYRYRSVCKDSIENYDSLLFITTFAAFARLTCIYMYWMWRFSDLVLVPVCVFGGLVCNHMTNRKERFVVSILISLSFGLVTARSLVGGYLLYGGAV